jgi:hypothetical protein
MAKTIPNIQSRRFAILAWLCFLALSVAPGSAAGLPDSWTGNWKGPCEITGSNPYAGAEVQAKLSIKKAGYLEWAYHLEYVMSANGAGSGEVRPYVLRHVSGSHYVLDERNGILLDHYLEGNKLFSSFSVGGNVIFTEEEFTPGFLRMSVRTYAPGYPQAAGVSSMALLSAQTCLLTR